MNWYRSTAGHALVGAVLLWAALPPLGIGPLAWIAPVWWVLLIRRPRLEGRRPYTTLWLVGLGFWLAALHWLRLPHPATALGWLALSFYFAFYLPVFVGLGRVAVHRLRVPVIIAAPVVWTGLELARAHILGGMTMGSLGHSQYRWIGLIQISDLAGTYAVSFVVMFVAACLARMLPVAARETGVKEPVDRSQEPRSQGVRVPASLGHPRAFWPLVPGLAVLAGVLAYGYARTLGEHTRPGPRIALIQGCVDAEMKSDPEKAMNVFREYLDLSQRAVLDEDGQAAEASPAGRRTLPRRPAAVVWPETMFPWPWYVYDDNARRPGELDGVSQAEFVSQLKKSAAAAQHDLTTTARWIGTPLILGIVAWEYVEDTPSQFNSAIHVGRGGEILGRYDKNHLVMFGEYVPLAGRFPWLHQVTPVTGSATPGDGPAAFRLGDVWVSPNICYESVLPHLIRSQVNTLRAAGQEPDVLVNLTNDGWFWGSSELDMHLACAVFRAVECRKPFLIAANTGFSAWIDGDGRIVRQGPRHATGYILADVELDSRTSWYLDHGDWPAGICLAACMLLAAAGGLSRFSCFDRAPRRRRGRRRHENGTVPLA